MRPIRLEMEGFTSFRDRTIVDFEDVDLFVLTGPTGAGKSSVIDAMIFALYGSIPRLDDRRAVAPVISRGMLEARVRLDFAVGGKQYTAVRVVRARSGGANTPEARLEDAAGNTLAIGADELTAKVGGILGLSFEHFTKSVVLPQGDFSELLHEIPSKRQDLLVRLLGTELYERIARRASQRETTSKALADELVRDINQLEASGISDQGLKLAIEREKKLDHLVRRLEAQQPKFECLRETMRRAKEECADIEVRLDLLREVRTPQGVPELAGKIAEERRTVRQAKEVHVKSIEARGHIQSDLAKLPREADLRLDLQHYENLEKSRSKRGEEASLLKKEREDLKIAHAQLEKEGASVEDAERAKRSMENEHRAYHLASGLKGGDQCPVCHQDVVELPMLEVPGEIEEVEIQLGEAKENRKCAETKLVDAQSAVAARERSFKYWEDQVKLLESELKDTNSPEDLMASLGQVIKATGALQKADKKEKKDLDQLTNAEGVLGALVEDENLAWKEYDAQRDWLAQMNPPSTDREDLAAAWKDLVAWSNEQARKQRAIYVKGEKARKTAAAAMNELRESIAEWCRDADVTLGDGEGPLTACGRELGLQTGEVGRIERALDDLNKKRYERELRRRECKVAAELARHLGARHFEGWLMAQVLNQLCVGASIELRKLSSGSYSLDLDENNKFLVVDHRNADERRPVKTLSGGETFLASLSLALALSEHLADLAVGGTAKLEALFLDEGFGTLDTDTLDVVISAIEELGSRGRMVGVVTHVKDLAERIPVRYEVTKEGNRSSIERVET